MSNLAHGCIRILGRQQNILNFLQNELKATYEKIYPVNEYVCNTYRENRNVQIQVMNDRIRIIRDPDTRMGFHFMADNYGQFIHTFDRGCSFTAPMEEMPKGLKVISLNRFSARYETVDTEWFTKMAKAYEIDIRIFLMTFESGVPDDSIVSYTFLYKDSMKDGPIVHHYGPASQLWAFPDRIQIHSFEKTKKQSIKDRIGGSG